VVGTGWWATTAHLPALRTYERADLRCLADPNPTNLEAASRHFQVAKTYLDYRDLLDAGDLDCVVIAVPHVYHYEIARDAIDAGLHVLLEKPMVLKTTDAWDLVARARAKDVHLVIGYESHFTRHAIAARELIQSGDIGELRFVSGLLTSMAESWYRDRSDDYKSEFDFTVAAPLPGTYSDPRIAGGGQGQTQVTHAMGLIFWTTDLRATDVSAFFAGFDLKIDLVDAISCRFDNAAVGTVGSAGTLRPKQPWQLDFRYYGSEGFVLHDTFGGQLVVHFNDGSSRVYPPLDPHEISPPSAPARCLVDLSLGEGENHAPGDVGARAVEFIEAAYRSVAERRVVSIGELQA
jgi:predicted dehydrogenase